MRHHFAPSGLFVSRFIFPRAMPWSFTFWAFGPDLSLHYSEEHLLAESVIKAVIIDHQNPQILQRRKFC